MLTIDDREARTNPTARNSLLRLLPNDIEVERLDAGDFASTDTALTLGIEHKSFGDLVGSLSSNRLDAQLTSLLNTYDVPVLLVDEIPAPSPNGKLTLFGARRQVNFAWVLGSVFGWALRGVIPMMVRTPGSVGPTVAALYRVCSKGEHRETYEPQRVLGNLKQMSLTERVLIQLPGVGPERASKLRDMTLNELAAMWPEDWKKVLGPITGQRAFDAWNPGLIKR